MEERSRLGSLLMQLAGAALIVRGGMPLLHRQLVQALESDNTYLLHQPHWQWIVLVVIGVCLILGSSHLGRLPRTDAGSMDLSMPAMGLLLLLGAHGIFRGLAQVPTHNEAFPSITIGYGTDAVASVLLGLTLLCFAPSISRCCKSVNLSDLYSGGLRFSAAVTGLWSAASLASLGLDRLFTRPQSEGASLDQQTLQFSSFSVNVFSTLLIIVVMIRMSIVGWRWVSEDQPQGDFIAPIVSFSALTAGLALYWPMHGSVTLVVLMTLCLLIGTSPRPIANLIRKLLVRFRPKQEAEA